jgi:hypothetical protein
VNAAGKVVGLARAVTSIRAELLLWFQNVLDEKRNKKTFKLLLATVSAASCGSERNPSAMSALIPVW